MSNPCYLGLFGNYKQNHLKFNHKEESINYLPFYISYYSTQSPEFTEKLNFHLFALSYLARSGSGTIIPDPGKSSRSMRIRIHNTASDNTLGPQQRRRLIFDKYDHLLSPCLSFFVNGICKWGTGKDLISRGGLQKRSISAADASQASPAKPGSSNRGPRRGRPKAGGKQKQKSGGPALDRDSDNAPGSR